MVSTATPTGEGVARTTDAMATFSERVNRDSITTSSIKLFKCSSTTSTDCPTQITNVTVTPSTDGLSTILNPFGSTTTRLAKSTRYEVVVTTEVTDEAGNRLDKNATRRCGTSPQDLRKEQWLIDLALRGARMASEAHQAA